MNQDVLKILNLVKTTADFGYVNFDSINATNELGENALHCVCVWGDLAAAKILVENGINIHQQGEFGFTPLRVASDFGFPEIAAYLIEHGADKSTIDAPEVFSQEKNSLHLRRLGEEIQALEAEVQATCGKNA